ncbi:LADA_0H12706g1_1 [Lachancea dasiensis]|uniref:LADA_0H12706g1_1 n=1 Tax=Lachancea dasiensis TaxID=1072105 RepID=A0A1G4K456_9SACH|nr:LADA_0H12706g1_1 [Lachancea dasiensis]
MNTSPGNSQKHARALDMLEKHISQQNKRVKGNNYVALSSMLQPLSGSSRLPAPSQSRPFTRSLNGPSPFRQTVREDAAGQESPTRLRSSPLRKSVAFSDKVDSSPPQEALNSSPRPSSMAKAPRPILKFSDSPIRIKTSPRRSRGSSSSSSDHRLPLELSRHDSTNPLTLDYWICGEVHSLVDINSIAEFRAILTGGLYFLSKATPAAKERFFEFYATFNNIMPVYSSAIYSDVKEKKLQILINNIDLILSTCVPQLIEFQNVLLKSSRKDPFVSRTYVQIVRFLTTIFSNFRLIRACEKNPIFLSSLQRVVDGCIETMEHSNSNKVMITAQLAFLRDEQCAIQRISAPRIGAIIKAMGRMKRIESTNLLSEKLLLLKTFLGKYTKVMLDTIEYWLPTEVCIQLIKTGDSFSSKICSICVSILLDLLKKCLQDSTHQNILCVLKQPAARHYAHSDILECQTDRTLEELLLARVEDFIVDKDEPRLALDLWLALVGLLFNAKNEIKTLCEEPINPWLAVNLRYQGTDDYHLKTLAFRSWRIVTFLICYRGFGDAGILNQQLCNTLLLPFRSTEAAGEHLRDQDYYVMRGVLYMVLCNNNKNLLDFALRNIVQSLLLDKSMNFSNNNRCYVLEVLNHMLCQPQSLSANKSDFNPLKVVASAGVKIEEFPPLTQSFHDTYWKLILDLAIELNKNCGSETRETCFEFLILAIAKIPHQSVSGSMRDICLEALSGSMKAVFMNSSRIISVLTTCMLVFQSHMWSTATSALQFREVISTIIRSRNLTLLDILKPVAENTKDVLSDLEVYNFFLMFKDSVITSYVSNAVTSKIRSAEISQSAFAALLSIAEKISTENVASTVMTICDKLQRELARNEHDIMNSLDLDALQKYLRLRLSSFTRPIDSEFMYYFGKTVRSHQQLQTALHVLLSPQEFSQLVLPTIMLESLNNANKPHCYLSWWEPCIMKYPKMALPEVLMHFDALCKHVQLWFIRRVLVSSRDSEIPLCFSFIENILNSPSDGWWRSNLEFQSLQCSFLNMCWLKNESELLARAIRMLVAVNYIAPIKDLLLTNPEAATNALETSTLIMLIEKTDDDKNSIIQLLKDRIRANNLTIALDALEIALTYETKRTFSACKNEFLELLLDTEETIVHEKKRTLTLLESSLAYLTSEDNSLLHRVLRKLFSRLPTDMGSLVFEQLSILRRAPSINPDEFPELRNLRENLASGVQILTLDQPIDCIKLGGIPGETTSRLNYAGHSINVTSYDSEAAFLGYKSIIPNVEGTMVEKDQLETRCPTDVTESTSTTKEDGQQSNVVPCCGTSAPSNFPGELSRKLQSQDNHINEVSNLSTFEDHNRLKTKSKLKTAKTSSTKTKCIAHEATLPLDETVGPELPKLLPPPVCGPSSQNIGLDKKFEKPEEPARARASSLEVNGTAVPKIPIFNSRKLSGNIDSDSSSQQANELLGSGQPKVQACTTDDSPKGEQTQDPVNFSYPTSPQETILMSDRKTRMIVQIIKQFGKTEFGQLSDTQKAYLKSSILRFVTNTEAKQTQQNIE